MPADLFSPNSKLANVGTNNSTTSTHIQFVQTQYQKVVRRSSTYACEGLVSSNKTLRRTLVWTSAERPTSPNGLCRRTAGAIDVQCERYRALVASFVDDLHSGSKLSRQ